MLHNQNNTYCVFVFGLPSLVFAHGAAAGPTGDRFQSLDGLMWK